MRPAQQFSNTYRRNFGCVQILLAASTGCVSGRERREIQTAVRNAQAAECFAQGTLERGFGKLK